MVEMFFLGGVIPGAVALLAMLAGRWLFPCGLGQRYAAAVAASLGLLTGYGLLPAWAPWWPTTYWHWLPYLGLVAGLVGPLTLADGVHWGERLWIRALLALLVAWFLVPTWARLEPVRGQHVAALAAYLLLLVVTLEPLASRVTPARLLLPLSLAAMAVSVMIAVALSLTFGQLGGIITASLVGTTAAAWLVPSSARELTVRGLIPWYAVLVGGLAYIGYINPNPRLGGLVILPAAPLVLWVFAVGPLANRLPPRWGWLIESAAVLAPIIVGAAWVLIATR